MSQNCRRPQIAVTRVLLFGVNATDSTFLPRGILSHSLGFCRLMFHNSTVSPRPPNATIVPSGDTATHSTALALSPNKPPADVRVARRLNLAESKVQIRTLPS